MTVCLTLRNYKVEVAIIPRRQWHLGGSFSVGGIYCFLIYLTTLLWTMKKNGMNGQKHDVSAGYNAPCDSCGEVGCEQVYLPR